MPIRNASIADAKDIQRLVNEFAKHQKMIPRSLNEIYERLRDFIVYEEKGRIVGVCALHVIWEDLAEIRSLAVVKKLQCRGIGAEMMKRAMHDARELGVKKIFALTYVPDFFKRFGFKRINKSKLPHKIWSDCIKCHKFPDCDETAVILDLKKGKSI